MTYLIKQHKNQNYYIYMEYQKFNIIEVGACPLYRDGTCGYPIRKMTYNVSEQSKALNTFNRYVKKYI